MEKPGVEGPALGTSHGRDPREVAAPAPSVLSCLIQPQEGLKRAGFKARKNPALKSHPKSLHTHTEALGQASVCLGSLRAAPAPVLPISKENPKIPYLNSSWGMGMGMDGPKGTARQLPGECQGFGSSATGFK